jgi:hypothetical protein
MQSGNSVRPQKWKNVLDLYDNGSYSAVWGNYDGSEERVLGVRWNGSSNLGYPNMAGNPVWYVEPKFLRKSLLLNLLEEATVSNLQDKDKYIKNILVSIRENA